jgi:predicted DNA repair protein MutK
MAGSSLPALIDDIATVMDDVVLMTKVAVRTTAVALGDDLALMPGRLPLSEPSESYRWSGPSPGAHSVTS